MMLYIPGKPENAAMSSLSTSGGVSFSFAAGGATTSLGSGHQLMDIQEHQDTFPDTPGWWGLALLFFYLKNRSRNMQSWSFHKT